MWRWKWLVALFVVGVLATIVGATSAFAHGTANPETSAPYGSWGEEMDSFCHGAGGMMGGWGMGGFHMGLSDPVTLERVAGTLGLTYEELTTRLARGETIAQIAQTEGVDTSLVVVTILAPQSEVLQVWVKYGYLSETQAQVILEQARLQVEQAIAVPLYGSYGPTYSSTYAPGHASDIQVYPYGSPQVAPTPATPQGMTQAMEVTRGVAPGGMMGGGMMSGMMGW